MTVSTPTWGPEWGTDAMSGALTTLKTDLGVTHVAIHPYARIDKTGRVIWRARETLAFTTSAAERAQAAGVTLVLKPHLAYWGAFKWRGEIHFDDERAWARFFESYTPYIVALARAAEAHHHPLFVVGTELERTVHRPEWRDVIAKVRAVYRGELSWAANWDGVERVPFWDALDVIGVQAYFPLTKPGAPFTVDVVRAGWVPWVEKLRALSTAHGKDVCFTEVGYPRGPEAGSAPWTPAHDDTETHRVQRAILIDAALDVIAQEKFIRGGFWWKWMPTLAPFDRDFSMKDPEVTERLRARWGTSP